jgi:hypothetical protein
MLRKLLSLREAKEIQEPAMEALTRLVSESFARHGFDRPLDYRRLKWSRWFRCDSHHSLLFVPSKPGVFAVAEEINVVTDASSVQRSGASALAPEAGNRKAEAPRMLAVSKFFEADDMAFVLDRMLSRYNPMRGRLESGRYFIRFVVIEDESQRRSIYTALNQWILAASTNGNGIGEHFATSLEITPTTDDTAPPDDSQGTLFTSAEMGRVIFSAHMAQNHVGPAAAGHPPSETSRAITDQSNCPKIHPCPFPSGF